MVYYGCMSELAHVRTVIISLLWVHQSNAQLPLYTTTEQPCAGWYDRALNICEDEEFMGIVGLFTGQPVKLTAPGDTEGECEVYQQLKSCAATVEAAYGQKILVSTGSYYNLTDNECTDCVGCDSFKINDECVSADLNPNEKVRLVNGRKVRVTFSSYTRLTDKKTRAELSLRAIGCSYTRLSGQQRDIMLEEVEDSQFNEDTTQYQVKVSCSSGKVLPDQKSSDMITCKRIEKENGSISYVWDYQYTLSCDTPRYLILLVGVLIAMLLLTLIIIVALAISGKLPCQKDLGMAELQSDSSTPSHSRTSAENDDAITAAEINGDPTPASRDYDRTPETYNEQELIPLSRMEGKKKERNEEKEEDEEETAKQVYPMSYSNQPESPQQSQWA